MLAVLTKVTADDAFVTSKPAGEGSGLGRETVRRIVVNGHGGSIGVESQPGDTR